jgi:prolyl oligopeptidase
MLYAYGGFNINIMPSYDPLAAFFINNLNGVYALANIRGGGYEKINI